MIVSFLSLHYTISLDVLGIPTKTGQTNNKDIELLSMCRKLK